MTCVTGRAALPATATGRNSTRQRTWRWRCRWKWPSWWSTTNGCRPAPKSSWSAAARTGIRHELADVLLYLVQLADKHNVDLRTLPRWKKCNSTPSNTHFKSSEAEGLADLRGDDAPGGRGGRHFIVVAGARQDHDLGGVAGGLRARA
jgi:hypothetical protein